MARARSIKPGFFHDTALTALPYPARLLFAGLWCYSDREGRILDNPRQIKHDILPDDNCNVAKLLDLLAEGDPPFIIRYQSGARRFIQIRTFSKHQNPHVKEPTSTLPAPGSAPGSAPGLEPTQHRASPENSGASRADSGLRTPDSLDLTATTNGLVQAAAVAVEIPRFPEAAKAVRRRFPATDDPMLEEIFALAVAEYPPLNDTDLTDAVRVATTKQQQSAALYKTTVPQVIRSWK